ncbi:ABC transporter substrate-binding protein [Agaribacterium sp. ZY112]|uniref:ABC transporter substrate-binding protein n=1 Tax=Agaribacterium sp. ZY112 TaxID=3233574 RepID=UPI003525612E
MAQPHPPLPYFTLVLIACFFACCHSYAATNKDIEKPVRKIQIAIQLSYNSERALFSSLIERFNQKQPHSQAIARYYRGDISNKVHKWINQKQGPDVIYWYSGKHIERLAARDQLKDLSAVWQQYQLHKLFDHAHVSAVSYQDKPYAVPVSYYSWAFYYRASSFEQFQLKPIDSWQNLIDNCKRMQQQGRHLIAMGNKSSWPLLAWFDYLDLRINGADFHKQLLSGQASWQGPETKKILQRWLELINAGCFNLKEHRNYKVSSTLPFLYHRRAAMILAGGYVVGNLTPALKYDFRISAFPTIESTQPTYSIAPIDSFVVPSYATLDSELAELLQYLAEIDFQLHLNEPSSRLPANRYARLELNNPLQSEAIVMLENSGSMQFFSRESHPELALIIADALRDFLDHRNIEKCQQAMQAGFDKFKQQQPYYGLPGELPPLHEAQ